MNYKYIADLISDAKRITVITGAGISTASGIPDFRGKTGIYTTGEYDPYKTFDIDYFKKDPSYFQKFAKGFIEILEKANPSKMHRFISMLESKGKLEAVITQNIDGLHKRAGNKKVYTVHGTIEHGHCLKCHKTYTFKEMKGIYLNDKNPFCNICGGRIKPDVVFFGEQVIFINESINAVRNCDLLLICGTSLQIAPVSIFPYYVSPDVGIIVINIGDVIIDNRNVVRINDELERAAAMLFKEVFNEDIGD
ncbi:RNA polymerase subunit sigma [candidate division TA06 bacterium]|uniref:protein acetyllysine N-acetyltransferase n=1 Tax=candidate division TA06 bacterium TaxID=2250710 RepID=A0A660SQK6_UNCT6|nr:MAG: RNA polymerase subunit sigma [candidate division TA06 bacterium]